MESPSINDFTRQLVGFAGEAGHPHEPARVGPTRFRRVIRTIVQRRRRETWALTVTVV